ncbi:MAG: fused MFS/spermidine synthase [Myxococcota bacterium]|nr:fused MFS/spermidine synthase [Myxococcota bacterium]
MTRVTWTVGAFLFVSGACSLAFELAWIRELRLVFGASTSATAVVMACFMGGLGVGGLALAGRIDRARSPLRWYAALEGITAVAAASSPFGLSIARSAYIAMGGSRALGEVGATVTRLVLCALVLGLPTVAMGGTLPAASRAVGDDADPDRRRVAALYALNTAGAAAGCVLVTFVAFEALGTRRTLWMASVANMALAATAWLIAGRLPPGAEVLDGRRDAGCAHPDPRWLPPRALVLGGAGVTGFVFCLLELVWYRLLSPLLGGSVFTFGLILIVALVGIGLGGVLAAALRRAGEATLPAFAWAGAVGAVAVVMPLAAGDTIAVFSAIAQPVAALGFAAQIAGWTLILSGIVLPVAVAAGAQFPLLVALLGRAPREAARDVSQAIAFNTAGAIAGSLAGGFWLIPAIGAAQCWRLAGALLIAVAFAAFAIDARRRSRGRVALIPATAVIGAAVVALCARGPTAAWRHSPIGAGLVDPDLLRTPNAIRSWLSERRRAIDWEVDGRESSVGIDSLNGVAFVVNGKNDGNARGDAATTVMLGLLGAFLHGAPRRSMVIGLGTGASAGWLAAVPTMSTVDVEELEPSVVEVARRSAAINHDVLQSPKVHVLFGDAREGLLASRSKYDLIASEPSNPYRAGVASLFTREFYEAARVSLEEDGMFLQWVQGYGIDGKTMRTVYATLASVFPVVQSWHLKSDDLLLVASRHSIALDGPLLRARMREEPFRTAFAVSWRVTELEGVLAHYVAGAATAQAVAREERGEVNTDDRNEVEYGFARGVSALGGFAVNDVRALARRHDDNLPPLHGGSLNWNAIEEQVVAVLADEGLIISRQGAEETPGLARRIAALNAYQQGDLVRVAREWSAQSYEPSGPTEIAILATALAELGSAAATPYIDTMRAFNPVEADATQARLSFRQGRTEEGMQALERAYAGYRTDPWPLPMIIARTLALSTEVVARFPGLAGRLTAALREPFVLSLAEEGRRELLAFAASRQPPGPPCVGAYQRFEPNPVWTEDFLASRLACYEATSHPWAGAAKRDLEEFIALSPQPFANGPTP